MQALYSKAIEVKPDATLYGNRAAARISLKRFEESLHDALKAVEMDPTYSKAFFRKGQSLQGRHSSANELIQANPDFCFHKLSFALIPTCRIYPLFHFNSLPLLLRFLLPLPLP